MSKLLCVLLLVFSPLAISNVFVDARLGSVIGEKYGLTENRDGDLPFNACLGYEWLPSSHFGIESGVCHRSNADLSEYEYNNEYVKLGLNAYLPLGEHQAYASYSQGVVVRNRIEEDGDGPYWFEAGIQTKPAPMQWSLGWLQRETKGSSYSLGSLGMRMRWNF